MTVSVGEDGSIFFDTGHCCYQFDRYILKTAIERLTNSVILKRPPELVA